MTRLTIIPNVEKKRLTFDGKIASGEHVELRVYDFADKIEDGRLRVRAVDFQGNTLAVFPVKARDENGDVEKDENGNDVWEQWGVDEDYEYATCVFNLNTIPALKYFRRGGECLIVLDDPESKTLYGSGHLCVLPWPKEVGKDEPVDLDAYPDNIMDFVRRLDDAEDKVEKCWQDVASALASVSNANTNANTAVTTAQNAMSTSSEAKTSAANALTDSAAAKKAAQDAEGLVADAKNAAQAAQDAVGNLSDVARSGSYNDLSDKPQIPSIKGLAKKTDVDHVENVLRGGLNGEISRAKAAEMALEASVEAKAESTALTSERQRAEAAENDLRARIAALKSFDVRVVNALPATGLANTVYLVPSAKGAAGNVRDEYLWINGAWEQIGSTAVDLSGYAKKSEVPTQFVKDAAASSDGKTLTLTKNDGSVVSFQGGSSGAVDSVNGQTGAVVLTGADIATSAENDKTVADALAEKADEFTEWVTTNLPAGVTVTSGPEWSALDGRWKMSTSDGLVWEGISGISGSEDAIFIQWYTEAPPSAPISTRKRVLRTGDADKLTDAQKAMLDGGPYLPLSGGTLNDGATIKLNSLGASIGGGPTDGTVYIEARRSGGSGIPASGIIILRAESVIKNNEELATEAQVNAKADKATTLAGYGITDGATKTELAALTAKVEYPLYAVPSTGVLKDRALNTTSLASVTVPDNFTDLLVRASVTSSLSVTMPDAIATKYGDTFPGEGGEYLITITKTGTTEAYVRTIKLEVANA